MPFPSLYRLSDATSFILMHILHYRYAVTKGNLERSFPDKSEKEIADIMKGFYLHLSDIIFETIKLLHISDAELRQRVEVRNTELVENLSADGKPVILFLGHYGNWEWVQEITRRYSRPTINAEIYRPIRNSIMNRLMKTIRSRFNTIPIPQNHAVRHLLQMQREGQQFLVGFISDQRPNSKNLYHWTTFLHQDTAYAIGGEEIGRHLNAHFLFLKIEKLQRGHYVMTIQEMDITEFANQDYPYTLQFMRMMEECIRKEPRYWLWSHNRWEFDREGNTIHKK